MKQIRHLFLLWLLPVLLAVAGMLYYANTPLRLPTSPLEFELKPGSSMKLAAAQIRQSGLIAKEWPLVMLARIMGRSGQIKPGIYELKQNVTPIQLLDILVKGQVAQATFTIVEGSTFHQLRAALLAHPALRHDTAQLSDREILQRLGASEPHPEGLFFPDTYVFNKGSSDLALLEQAYRSMQRQLQKAWQEREPGLPFTSPYQALILASIVEKETGKAEDRPMIAAVFINRLRHPMRLQTDPTVIYGLGEHFDGNIRKQDLLRDTAYNTYTRDGLPPTPIAMPGRAAIHAVMHPAPSKALYFVARGDGSSHFSSTLQEHNQAVRRYQLKK